MKRFVAGILSVMTLASAAQQLTPRIGYVYPAGGRQGTTFSVVVGGQRLDGVTNAYVFGSGVQAVVVDYRKPMNQGEFNLLRDKLKELMDRKQAAFRGKRRGPGARAELSTNIWTAADEKTFLEIRDKILKNPPNRNATPAIAETATLKITMATDAAPGQREIRLASFNGLSNPLVFHVGELPESSAPPARVPNPEADRFRARFARAPTNPPVKAEMRVTLPAVVNGQIMPGEVDRFRFAARQGQKLVVAAQARSLIPYLADAVPGWFQATLALYDSKGKEVAYDDDYRFSPDPVLFYQIARDDDYIVAIKDAVYRGREDFVYRITLGELPFMTSSFPLGGPLGAKTTVEVNGWNLPKTRVTEEPRAGGIQWCSLDQDLRLCNEVPFMADTLPEKIELEPNQAAANAQRISLPVIINGRIASAGDRDVFSFAGQAGEAIVAEVYARRLGSPLDSVLRLTDASGRQIAFNDDSEDRGSGLNTHHADARLSTTLSSSGTFYLELAEAQQKGGVDYAYRLRLSAPRPDFELRVTPSTVNLRGGASGVLTVYVLRKDEFSNEVALVLRDAPPGFKLSGDRVPANQDQVRLTLTAPPTVFREPFAILIEGRANIHGRDLVRQAVPAEDMMQAFAYRHLVPTKELKVAVSSRNMARSSGKILSAIPVKIPAGGTARVQVGLPASLPAGKLHLELSEPPEGIAIQDVSPARPGTAMVLQSDPAKVKPGLAGNLIVNAFLERPSPTNASRPRPERRNVPLGTLPAIPFEVVPH